jgi:hypothetical protein
MNQSDRTVRPSRRVILTSGISLLGFGTALTAPVLFSGCGEDKGQIGQVENPVDPTQKAKDSMQYYQQSKGQGGAAKKK